MGTEALHLLVSENELSTSERERLAFAESRVTELELQLALPAGALGPVAAKMIREKDIAVRILAERLKAKTQYSGSVDNIITSAYMEAVSRSIS